MNSLHLEVLRAAYKDLCAVADDLRSLAAKVSNDDIAYNLDIVQHGRVMSAKTQVEGVILDMEEENK